MPGGARSLEISGSASGLLDDPLTLRARGAGPDEPVTWHARLRDDDGRVWRTRADRADGLIAAWAPAKAGGDAGRLAALGSLRPVRLDVRAESADGRAAGRTLTRLLLGDGVRVRRWRDGVAATLHLPPGEPCATVAFDATTGAADDTDAAALAAALLASRGALVLTVASTLDVALERLETVPGARDAVVLSPPSAPPGVGVRDDDPGAAAARAHGWDELLARLGALPRASTR